MAAITTTAASGRFTVLRSAATTTQTDWVAVPSWATSVVIYLDVSATGGSVGLTINSGNIFNYDDGRKIPLGTPAAKTAATFNSYTITPEATAVADAAGASTAVVIVGPVPALIGITATVTTSGTYSTGIEFKKA